MEFVGELLEDKNEGEMEEWGSPISHLIAGAIAGTAEHVGMYPIDTIKTHMQAYENANLTKANTIIGTTKEIIKHRGIPGLFKGVSAVAAGAAPAHAIYFSTYEFFKNQFGGFEKGHHPIAVSSAGCIATILSDAVLTPMDAIKQKMQLGARSYNGLFDCVKSTYKQYNLKGFYAGYTTTLTMNIPYTAIYFTSYESLKQIITKDIKHSEHTIWHHLLAGSGAGILSAAFTNPLDVAKTRLQTQSESVRSYSGMNNALKSIWIEEGVAGFCRGVRPRMISHSVSAAICWATYEFIKKMF
eukprot:TRINITY_DN3067_c0_g2_i2.p1 TRINITY_DN3067_c0_g2~~TRINITY_DN3067_c0_g2_i2.p1  ORF type:complete len:299 (+),score=131.32 TRINITY_DN3067_c0_g2_i2:94-990(+)